MTKRAKREAKAPKGTRIEVSIKKQVLGQAPEEHHFVLKDGKRLASVLQLVDELETMSEDIFRHHVTFDKNDFSNWLRDVFKEPNLAEEMRHISEQMEAQRVLLKHVMRKIIKEAQS